MNVRPAIVSVPSRSAPVFASIVNVTVPLPGPPPDTLVNHAALLAADHAQVAVVETVTAVPGPPDAPIDCVGGVIVYVHGVGAAAWVTVKVRPAIVSVPARPAPVFAATVKSTEPPPLPVAPDVIVNQGALLVAVQLQPADAETTICVPAPPAAPIDCV